MFYVVAGNPSWQMLLLCCDRQWTVRASTASPTRCPETRRWWWSTAMTKTQTCSRYCSEKTKQKKNTLKYLLLCSFVHKFSVCLLTASWQISFSPISVCLTSTTANQNLWYGTQLYRLPKTRAQIQGCVCVLVFEVWSAHEGSSHTACSKWEEKQKQEPATGTKQKLSL